MSNKFTVDATIVKTKNFFLFSFFFFQFSCEKRDEFASFDTTTELCVATFAVRDTTKHKESEKGQKAQWKTEEFATNQM